MIAAKFRLRGKESFAKVEKEGKIVQSSSFGTAFLNRRDDKPSAFGAVVSKKVSGSAVIRNKIKRTFFEVVRTGWKNIKPGFDVVFLAKSSSPTKSKKELSEEIKEALKKAAILR